MPAAALTGRSCQHSIESTARDIECLAQQTRWPWFSTDDGDHAEVAGTKNSGLAQSQVWQQHLRETLSIAQKAGLKVLVIAPVPYFSLPVPLCLAHRRLEECAADRISIERTRALLIEALQRIVAESDNARIWDPFDVLCGQRICPAAHANLVLYSDRHHLSIDGLWYLATFAAPELNWLVH
jgi:Zn-dependent protease with chaperone function